MALLAQYQHLAPNVRWMYVADIAVRPRLRGGELHGRLGFGLHDLFNPNLCDLEAMGVLQLIDEGEFHVIPLVHHQTGGQPDLGAVEDHVHQGELLGFSRCGISSTQHQDEKQHNEPAAWSAPPISLSHGDISFAPTRASFFGENAQLWAIVW
jgi:hypothetical protein